MSHPRAFTRRHLQVVLGTLWLLDAALQLQPFMFSTSFAHQILAPAGDGQPGWVAAPVHLFATQFGHHPVLFNAVAAVIQLALGVGFLAPRTVRAAVLASIGWSVAVWSLGEGFGGLASGHASLLTGAPGAALLYGVLAAASWPRRQPADALGDRPAAWLPWAWAALWLGGSALQLLVGQNRPGPTAAALRDSANGAPGWLARIDRDAGTIINHAGASGFALLVIALAAVGIGALIPGRFRTAAAYTGAGLAALFWVIDQNVGMLYSGQATDPNTGVVLIVFAAATAAIAPSFAAHTKVAGNRSAHDRAVLNERAHPSQWAA